MGPFPEIRGRGQQRPAGRGARNDLGYRLSSLSAAKASNFMKTLKSRARTVARRFLSLLLTGDPPATPDHAGRDEDTGGSRRPPGRGSELVRTTASVSGLAACRRAFVNARNDLRKGADREPPLGAAFCQTGPETLTTGMHARACSAHCARRANLLQKWSLPCQSCTGPRVDDPAEKPPGVAAVAAFWNAFAAKLRCREIIQVPVSWRLTTPDPARADCHFG
jgi:hypothetical protein